VEITWPLLSGLIPLKVLIWHWVGHFYSLWHKWTLLETSHLYSVVWTQDWTGLRESCVHHFRRLKWHRKCRASTYWVFYLQHSCQFSANLHIIVLYNSWPTLEERTALIIADKHSYTRWCNQFWERCGFLDYFYAATKFDLGDLIILLTIWIWILIPRLIICFQSGNDTNVNIHVGFSRWGVTVHCSRSVYGRTYLQYCHWIVAS